jgi:hypothetical protein
MTCVLQIATIAGTSLNSDGTPASIVVTGSVSGDCLQVRAKLLLPDALSAFAVVENGMFQAELLLGTHYQSGEIWCGQTSEVTLRVECLDGDTCEVEERIVSLDCPEDGDCDLAFATPNAVIGVANENEPLAPATLTISGTASVCTPPTGKPRQSTVMPGLPHSFASPTT